MLKKLLFCVLLLGGFSSCGRKRSSSARSDISCAIYPPSNAWNTDISQAAVDTHSSQYLARLAPTWRMKFVSNLPINIIDSVADGIVDVEIDYTKSSGDLGPMPIPTDAVYHVKASDKLVLDDNHLVLLDQSDCQLYELWGVNGPNSDGSWSVGSGAIFDLTSNTLRPDLKASSSASGLPVFVGMFRYDEAEAGVINHALSITATFTKEKFFRPATSFQTDSVYEYKFPLVCNSEDYFFASLCDDYDNGDFLLSDPYNVPMGLRIRLKSSFDLSPYSGEALVILKAAKKYGFIVTDGSGESGVLRGEKVLDSNQWTWGTDIDRQLNGIALSNFEMIDGGTLLP